MVSSLVAICFQPLLGRWLDYAARRKPFVVGLAVLGASGMLLFMMSVEITGDKAFVAVLVGFVLSDVCHDSLLIPGRAMIEDLCEHRGDKVRNRLNVMFSQFQMFGRVFSLTIGAFPVELYILPDTWFVNIPRTDKNEPALHMIGLMICAFTFLVSSVLLLLLLSPAEGVHALDETTALLKDKDVHIDPMFFRIMLVVHFCGWIGCMIQVFYWTSFIDETKKLDCFGLVELNTSYLGLCFGSLVSLASSFMLESANKQFGAVNVYFLAQLINFSSFFLLQWTGNSNGSIIVGGLIGLFYAAHQNNIFVILHTDEGDDEHTGWTVSLISSAMPAAQVIVGFSSGYLLENIFQGDFLRFFLALGVAGLVVDTFCFIFTRFYVQAN
mmetsp:Transcript_45176/g.72371  ORF Transcript_45176/g.72371 Transcript_45176/m.72371 type:complete len:383 (-) Transcript_45176:758-1906(-)